jgi:hypothetical protein
MILVKYSYPGWEKHFETMDELVTELRSHICGSCLSGNSEFSEVVDTEYNGIIYECRDVGTLLSTSCGCEYGMEE